MDEKKQLEYLNSQMTHCISAIKRIEVVLVGDDFNKEGMLQTQEKMKKKLEEIEQYHNQQKGGLSVGKWLMGTAVGVYLLGQMEQLQEFISKIFK